MADETSTAAEVVETTTDATATQTSTTIDPAEYAKMQAALKAANKEAADRRKKLEAYEQAEKEKAESEMTASQKAEARAAEAEKKAQEAEAKYNNELLKNAFISQSQQAVYGPDGKGKIASWEAAMTLVKADPENKDLEPEGVAEALKKICVKFPFLVGAPTVGAPPATPGDSQTTATTSEIERRRQEYERSIRNRKP